MFKKKYGKTVYILIFLIFSIAVLVFLGKVFMPKYRSSLKEGGLTGDYYLEKVPHDLIFLGDCEVFENFSPAVLWESYGISSYIRGSPSNSSGSRIGFWKRSSREKLQSLSSIMCRP